MLKPQHHHTHITEFQNPILWLNWRGLSIRPTREISLAELIIYHSFLIHHLHVIFAKYRISQAYSKLENICSSTISYRQKKAYLLNNNKKWQPCIEISARVFIHAIQNFGMERVFRDG